jgi:hypothetical protein
MTNQYAQTGINLIPAPRSADYVLIYSPLSVGMEADSVFGNFSDLYEQFQNSPGIVQIYLDYDGGLPAEAGLPVEYRSFPIPLGDYDFERRATFTGRVSTALCIIVPESGVEIVRLNGIQGGVGLYNTTSAPVVLVSEEDVSVPEIFLLRDGATLAIAPGAAPVMRMAISGTNPFAQSVLGLDVGSVIDPLAVGTGVIEVAPGGQVIVSVLNSFSEVQADVFVGDATTAIFGIIGSPSANVNITSQASFLGVIFEVLIQDSDQSLYSPSNLVDWSGIDPGNVAEALNRIAAAIGPIA